MNAAATLNSIRYTDHASRVGQIDARLGRPQMPPPGRSQTAAYRAAYRATIASMRAS
jgi:hypothetical protein